MRSEHSRPTRRRAAAIAALAVVVVCGLALAGALLVPRLVAPAAGSAATPTARTAGGGPKLASSPSAGPASAPRAAVSRLLVPAIGVDAAIEQVGADGAGRMATPSEADHVAWYKLGAAPGESGNAVIDGHLDWTTGPAVFWNLNQLVAGNGVTVVLTDGTRLDFVVDTKTAYSYDASPPGLFTRVGPPGVALVTCMGSWDRARNTYLQRLVVHATLAPTQPSSTPGDEAG